MRALSRARIALPYLLILAIAFLPAILWAQGDSTVVVPAPDPASLTMFGMILLLALPGVSSVLAKLAYDGLKTIFPFYDKLSPSIHQIAAPIFSFLFGWVVAHLGLKPVDSVAGIDFEWFNASLTTLGSAGIYRWQKAKHPGDATIKVEQSRAGATAPSSFTTQR